MRIRGGFLLIPILALASVGAVAPEGTDSGAGGPYLGQPPPGREPKIFAPGIVSTGMYERDIAMTPGGKEIYFGVIVGETVTIAATRLEKGRWTDPEIPDFASDPRFAAFEPHVTPDGRRILFLSTRPPAGREPRPGWFYQNIWASDRMPDGSWGEPFDLGPPVNTEDEEYYPSVTRHGTLYFSRARRGETAAAIYRARWADGKYAEPERLPETVNGRGGVYNGFIDPNERYLIACVGGEGAAVPSYNVFFRDPNDRWSEGIRLGEAVNHPGSPATSAYVSPDGKYLFFASSKLGSPGAAPAARLALDFLERVHDEPGNGSSDVYWVEASLLEDLRPEGFR